LANECDLVIATTEKEKLSLQKYYNVLPEKISVIPCGVNLELFYPLDKLQSRRTLGLKEGNIILFVGRIERLKGIDKIIQAMPYIANLNPYLLIVGEDGNRAGEKLTLKNMAENLGVANSISFTGLADYNKLPMYYNAADVCVLPSYYESFGLVPLESLACGTPMVATDVGDLRNIIIQGKTGYVVSGNSPQILAEKLGAILTVKNSRFKNPDYIRSTVEKFNWMYIASSVENEMNKLIVECPVHK
jgi:D-inositol-3-phosphate glycosyltransferase